MELCNGPYKSRRALLTYNLIYKNQTHTMKSVAATLLLSALMITSVRSVQVKNLLEMEAEATAQVPVTADQAKAWLA